MKNRFRSAEIPTGIGSSLLIPVDFSKKDLIAVEEGFALAFRLGLEVTLIHATPIPEPYLYPQFPDDYNGTDTVDELIGEEEMIEESSMIADKGMKRLKDWIRQSVEEGKLPEINIHEVIAPGMPEEVICEYCSVAKPALVVMATRDREQRQEELVGSVTAEVVDNCRTPVWAIPEGYSFVRLENIVRLCSFCYLEGFDHLGIDFLMKMFSDPVVEIHLFPINDKLREDEIVDRMAALFKRLSERYPQAKFIGEEYTQGEMRQNAENLIDIDKIQMIIAPNKKRNFLARLFHPGLPHRILFENDLPLLAIPV